MLARCFSDGNKFILRLVKSVSGEYDDAGAKEISCKLIGITVEDFDCFN